MNRSCCFAIIIIGELHYEASSQTQDLRVLLEGSPLVPFIYYKEHVI